MDQIFVSDSENKFFTKKNIITLLLIGILVLGIPVGVDLVQKQQFLRSRAIEDPITFAGVGVKCDSSGCTTTDTSVTVDLRSPFGPPGTPGPSINPSPTGSGSPTPTVGGPTATPTLAATATPTPSCEPRPDCLDDPVNPCLLSPPLGTTWCPATVKYSAYGAYTYTAGGQQRVLQSLVNKTGTKTWGRSCTINLNDGLPTGCGSWSQGYTITMTDGSSVGSYGAYSYKDSANTLKVLQSLVNTAGTKTQARSCNIDLSSGLPVSCGAWSQLYNIALTDSSAVGSYGAYSYTSGSTQKVLQSLVNLAGTQTQARSCDIDLNTGLPTSCGAWSQLYAMSDTGAYGAYSYTSGSTQKVLQSLVNLAGTESKARSCNINLSDGLPTSCGAWTQSYPLPTSMP